MRPLCRSQIAACVRGVRSESQNERSEVVALLGIASVMGRRPCRGSGLEGRRSEGGGADGGESDGVRRVR